ncbi:MAG: CheR family methyltransferase [Candidatus Methanoperedens sp.]
MITRISDNSLSLASEFVATNMCLHFPIDKWCDLERGINSASEKLGFKDAESCIKWLVNSQLTKKQIEILASYLTTGETYFFRDKTSFEALEDYLLPDLIFSRRGKEPHLRIWCAGCSSGEEPYSIAIQLSKMIPDLKDWNITILATDINPLVLQKASNGVYSEWSFRDTPAWIRKYFKKTKNGFEILPDIKKMVTFSYHNLAEDTYPSLLNNTNAMDIIFCRNVMIYFSPENTKRVVQNFHSCLIEGGWLIVSPVETSHILYSQFKKIKFHDRIFYKKNGNKSQKLEEPVTETAYYHPTHGGIQVAPPPPAHFAPQIEKPPTYEEALALYEKGKYSEAVEIIAKLVSSDPNNSKTILLLAQAYANMGKLTEANEWCEKAIKEDRLNPRNHYLHATILEERGQIDDAVKSLKKALYLDQDFVLAHFGLGNLCKKQGKSKESEKYFETALMLLRRLGQNETLLESEGITAGRLSEIITTMRKGGESI